jgi:hypothetical protein
LELRRGDGLREEAERILERERERLGALVPSGELTLTGGSSLADALTTGDVDLHLRVPPSHFAGAVAALKRAYPVVHGDIWTDEFATFEAPGHPLLVGIAVTAIGKEHDVLFVRSWELLASDATLLAKYNSMKRASAGGPVEIYRAAKSDFFAGLPGDQRSDRQGPGTDST